MKKIFLVVPHLAEGGQERFVSELTFIIQNDYDSKLILFDDTKKNYPYCCECIVLDKMIKRKWTGRLKGIQRSIQLFKLLKKEKPYACISFGNSANLVNGLAKIKNTRCIMSIRGYGPAEILKSSLVQRKIFSRSDKMIGVSMEICDFLKQIFPKKSGNVFCLYNAYDIKKIEAEKKELCENIWGKTKYKIVSIGALKYEKGYWHLIKAVYLAKQKLKDIKLVIVGIEHQDYSIKMNKLIHELNLEENVILLGHKKNPFPYVDMADLYVLSSVREGFPNALVESMLCKKPVIAADCKTGPREILLPEVKNKINEITECGCGIMIPELGLDEDFSSANLEDAKKLSEAIIYLLKDEHLKEKMAQNSLVCGSQFTYEKCRKEFMKIVEL